MCPPTPPLHLCWAMILPILICGSSCPHVPVWLPHQAWLHQWVLRGPHAEDPAADGVCIQVQDQAGQLWLGLATEVA